jgi:hypothetical protein
MAERPPRWPPLQRLAMSEGTRRMHQAPPSAAHGPRPPWFRRTWGVIVVAAIGLLLGTGISRAAMSDSPSKPAAVPSAPVRVTVSAAPVTRTTTVHVPPRRGNPRRSRTV